MNPAMVNYVLRDAAARDIEERILAQQFSVNHLNPVLPKDYFDLIFFAILASTSKTG